MPVSAGETWLYFLAGWFAFFVCVVVPAIMYEATFEDDDEFF